jgi:hypothetical protein
MWAAPDPSSIPHIYVAANDATDPHALSTGYRCAYPHRHANSNHDAHAVAHRHPHAGISYTHP